MTNVSAKSRKKRKKFLLLLLFVPLLLPLERLRREMFVVGKWKSNGVENVYKSSGESILFSPSLGPVYGKYRIVGFFYMQESYSYYVDGRGTKRTFTSYVNDNLNSEQSLYSASKKDDYVTTTRFWINWNGSKMSFLVNKGEEKSYSLVEKCGGVDDACK